MTGVFSPVANTEVDWAVTPMLISARVSRIVVTNRAMFWLCNDLLFVTSGDGQSCPTLGFHLGDHGLATNRCATRGAGLSPAFTD